MNHRAPLITLLSSSPAAARRAVKLLSRTTSLRAVGENETFHRVIPWVLVKTVCRDNGTLVQWLAPEHTSSASSSSPPSPRHSLLAVQADMPIVEVSCNPNCVLDPFESTLSRAKLRISSWLRRPVSPSHLLGPSQHPVLHLDKSPSGVLDDLLPTVSANVVTSDTHPPRRGLKEIVIPLDEDESSDDGVARSVRWDQLSRLSRPATGLYELPGSSLCLRPLSAGLYDRTLPPPSLIFHCESDPGPSLAAQLSLGNDGDSPQQRVTLRRIGHAGGGGSHKDLVALRHGQYRLESDDLSGLDVRLCGSEAYQSMFCEAHESLLAGSLEQLQSLDVLGAGRRWRGLPVENSAMTSHHSKENRGTLDDEIDPRTVSSDCWIEFRANLRRPSGFFNRRHTGKGGSAKAPELPYD
jgi:hypothetical protein